METGGQCAMITGPLWMLMWLVSNLDTLALVCRDEQSLFMMLMMTAYLISLQRFNSFFQCTVWAE